MVKGIVGILLFAMFASRRRDYSILRSSSTKDYRPLIGEDWSPRSSQDSDRSDMGVMRADQPPKRRRILGLWTVKTPNSSRFANHLHSRILQKYPFLIEMFYWIITYLFYRMTARLSSVWYGGTEGLWEVAQDHGIAILEIEAWALGSGAVAGTERWTEWRVQHWFLDGVQAEDYRQILLTILNRVYALIHVPGTVG